MTINITYKEKALLPNIFASIFSFAKSLTAKRPELDPIEIEQARQKAQIFNLESKIPASEIKVFASNDPILLKKYYDLRHESFRYENGWSEYDGSESNYDREGQIIIATNSEGEVVGGGRLMFSSVSAVLSSEYPDEGFSFREILQKDGIDTQKEIFSEVSSFVVAKKYRNRYITELMLDAATKISAKNKCRYVIGVGNILCCRDYRMIFKKLGYELTIRKDIPWVRKKMQNFAQGYMMVVPIFNGPKISNN